jgi:hypothetical protein
MKATAEWVAFIADIVRRGQAEGDLRRGLDPAHVAAVLVGAFDGLKSLTDTLEPGEQSNVQFRHRVHTLLELVERALMA